MEPSRENATEATLSRSGPFYATWWFSFGSWIAIVCVIANFMLCEAVVAFGFPKPSSDSAKVADGVVALFQFGSDLLFLLGGAIVGHWAAFTRADLGRWSLARRAIAFVGALLCTLAVLTLFLAVFAGFMAAVGRNAN